MQSMTGYGYSEAVTEGTQVSVEIKSVNSRFLDLSVTLPPFLGPLEQRVREAVGKRVVRGKVDVFVRVRDGSSRTSVHVDADAARAFYGAIRDVALAIGKDPDDIPLSLVIAQEGVLTVTRDYDAELYWGAISGVLDAALGQFVADREREGQNLARDLLEKLGTLDTCAAFFREWQPQMESRFREQIRRKFEELLSDRADETRIMQETAALLVKYTINEEIVRLQSHLSSMRDELSRNPAPGKRLDFICQEANREINTIGSKNQFVEVGQMVITAKDAIENIREQCKNLE